MSFPIHVTEVCWWCHNPLKMKIVDDRKHFCSMKCHYQYKQAQNAERKLEEEREEMCQFAEGD
jgi:hypothetical protein